MAHGSQIRGAEVRLRADEIRVSLEQLRGRLPDEGLPALERPTIVPPKLHDEFALGQVRRLALRELLRHADSGRARVRVPLPPKSLRVGPLSVELKEGTEAIIDLEVKGAQILRGATKGMLEPPIELPLGMSFRGLYVNEHGEIIGDIAGFPDLNLSQLSARVPRIPATLDEVLELLPEQEGNGATMPEGNGAQMALRVEARDVVPRAEPFSLGEAGEVVFGPDTRLDVDFTPDGLTVRGRVEVLDATLLGVGFSLVGLAMRGTFAAQLQGLAAESDLQLDVTCFEATVQQANLALRDGAKVQAGPVTLGKSSVSLLRQRGDLRFLVETDCFEGALVHASLAARVGKDNASVEVHPTTVRGRLRLTEVLREGDLEFTGARLQTGEVRVPLGLAQLDVCEAHAEATGRVRFGTDFGVAFTGSLALEATLGICSLQLGSLNGRLAPGGRGALRISQLAASVDGLEALQGEGELDLLLETGQVPLGSGMQVRFSSGATGRLILERVEQHPGERWPWVHARGFVEAMSDPTWWGDGLLGLPAGLGRVEGAISIDP
ncbi:MAG: hypothetical protein ACO3JL_12920, partial [Myxococcota bacterium]